MASRLKSVHIYMRLKGEMSLYEHTLFIGEGEEFTIHNLREWIERQRDGFGMLPHECGYVSLDSLDLIWFEIEE